jgi:hypothetical protein
MKFLTEIPRIQEIAKSNPEATQFIRPIAITTGKKKLK